MGGGGVGTGEGHTIWNKSWEDSKLVWEFLDFSNVTICKSWTPGFDS